MSDNEAGWREFNLKYKAGISFDEYLRIMVEERRANEAEAQRAQEGQMRGEAMEESNAKCNLCYADLSIIENMLYGNRCMFCASNATEGLPLKNIGLWQYLWLCYFDWLLYQEIVKLWVAKGQEEARLLLLGCLAEIGYTGITMIRSIKAKRKLCKRLKFYRKEPSAR